MNDIPTSTPTPEELETHRRFRRVLNFWGFLVASIVTLLALAWAVENWRGARAWSAVKRDLVARGEPLSFDQLVRAMPPDDQNFARTPLLRPLFDYTSGGTPEQQSPFWQAQARLNAIALPPTHDLRHRHSRKVDPRDEQMEKSAGIDLMSYALGIRMRPRKCPPHLDPALAERYGYLPPGVPWKKPTNDVELAASITDPAQEVLDFLKRFDPELQEIAEAVRRPYSQFPIHWKEGYSALLPHLAPLKQFDLIFRVRSAARLRKHDVPGAFDDVMTCLRLAESLRSEPLLISQVVGMAQHSIAVKSVWQGMIEHQWNADQLAAFQREFARFNFQTQAVAAVRGERAGQNEFLEHFNRASLQAVASDDDQHSLEFVLLPWFPGWLRQNQVRLNRYDEIELRQLTDSHWPVNLVGALDAEAPRRAIGLEKQTPYTLLARVLAPDLTKVQKKAARAQAVNQLALVACALERFRIEHGGYPAALSELSSADLPGSSQDPMSGAPLHYERSKDQSFKLWSVGLDGQDDGGVLAGDRNDVQGDWVWPQPGSLQPTLF